MIGKVIVENNNLYFINENGNHLYVKNAFKQTDGFHQVSGWYIYPEPLSLGLNCEVYIEDEKTCSIIRQIN
jgi:hypothetical protein